MNRRLSGAPKWGFALAVLTVVGHGALAQNGSPRIPLKAGLTIVTALNEPDTGDYESIKVIVRADRETVRLEYSADVQASGDEENPMAALFGGATARAAKKQGGSAVRHVRATRTVFRRDLESAIEYRWHYGEELPETYPGSTAVGVSKRVLNELGTKGETELRVPVSGVASALGSLIGGLLGGSSPELAAASMASGTLKRVSPDMTGSPRFSPARFCCVGCCDQPISVSTARLRIAPACGCRGRNEKTRTPASWPFDQSPT